MSFLEQYAKLIRTIVILLCAVLIPLLFVYGNIQQRFIPETCQLSPEISCTHYAFSEDTTSITLQNNLPYTITIHSFEHSTEGVVWEQCLLEPLDISPQEQFTITCALPVHQRVINEQIQLSYTTHNAALTYAQNTRGRIYFKAKK